MAKLTHLCTNFVPVFVTLPMVIKWHKIVAEIINATFVFWDTLTPAPLLLTNLPSLLQCVSVCIISCISLSCLHQAHHNSNIVTNGTSCYTLTSSLYALQLMGISPRPIHAEKYLLCANLDKTSFAKPA